MKQYRKLFTLILTLTLITAVACSQATPEETVAPTPTVEQEAPVETAEPTPVEEAPTEEPVEPTPEPETEPEAEDEETPEVTPEEEASDEEETTVYINAAYGYRFNVPAGYEAMEYTDDMVAVGTPIEGGFDAVANVDLVTPFDDSEEQTESFETAAGQEGILFYLTEEQHNFETDEVQTSSKGPFIVLDISDQLPEESYAALLIYPAIPLAPDEVDADLLRGIAASVEFERES